MKKIKTDLEIIIPLIENLLSSIEKDPYDALLLLTVIHERNASRVCFSNVTTLLRIHLAGYISIKELLALQSKKR